MNATKTLKVSATIALLAFLTTPLVAETQLSESDQAIVVKWKARNLAIERFTKHTDGEDMAWLMTPFLRGTALMAEALDGDRECLDMFCRAFEHIMSITGEDIDGLVGWPTKKGNYGKQGPRCIIMDDALICGPVGIFGRVVKKDPKLNKLYGARYEKYTNFVEGTIFPKWTDSWLELGEKAVTFRFVDGQWRRIEVDLAEPAGVYRFYQPGKKPAMSLPLNQFWHVARAYLAFYDATGKDEYLDKVKKMAATGKYVYLVKKEDRYEPWCYWNPVYEGDFKEEGEPVTWVGPHPYRSSYSSFEVTIMAKFHQRGIVFTDDDIRRLVRLHLDVQRSGRNPKSPEFKYRYEYGGRNRELPCRLWTSLAYFDPTIAKLAAKGKDPEALQRLAEQWRGIVGVPERFLSRENP